MRFAHLKTHHGFERLRLRGLSGARDEFHLAAIVQEPQDNGAASRVAAARPRGRVSCVRVDASGVPPASSPLPQWGCGSRQEPPQPRNSEGTKPVTPPTLSTASTQSGH
jgi:hypothetical protein